MSKLAIHVQPSANCLAIFERKMLGHLTNAGKWMPTHEEKLEYENSKPKSIVFRRAASVSEAHSLQFWGSVHWNSYMAGIASGTTRHLIRVAVYKDNFSVQARESIALVYVADNDVSRVKHRKGARQVARDMNQICPCCVWQQPFSRCRSI